MAPEPESKEIAMRLDLVKDQEFRVTFDGGFDLLLDEPPPVGGGAGPNASAVLAAAVGNCLSASLTFCLRKSRIEPSRMSADVRATLARDAAGRWRVADIRVAIDADVPPEARSRAERCVRIFEDYCVVTQSVRRGIDVRTRVSLNGDDVPVPARAPEAGVGAEAA